MNARAISLATMVSLCSAAPAVADQGGLKLWDQAQQTADLGITFTGYQQQRDAALIDYDVDVVADIRGETLTGPLLYAQMADLGITFTGYEKLFGAQPINASFDSSNWSTSVWQ